MAYTEVTTRSWGQRLGSSFKGIMAGLVIFALGTCLLWWNEGRTFKTAGAIGEAELLTQEVSSIDKLDPSLDGELIHATGIADTQDILRDDIFGINARSIGLRRVTEFFQWREHSHSETKKKLGGGEETVTTYTYDTGWASSPVDSGKFRDPEYRSSNIILADIKDQTLWAKDVSFGAYRLPDFMIHSIGGEKDFTIETLDKASVSQAISIPESIINLTDNGIYIGTNPSKPSIGDVRVKFYYTQPAEISIIAQVTGDTFKAYTASNGYTFSRLAMGNVSMSEMFKGARSGNKILAWLLRALGLIVVVTGLNIVLAPLSVLADFVPFIGNIVGAGTRIVSWLLGLAWSLVIIAVAWVRFRPLVAGSLIAAAIVLVIISFMKGRRSVS